MSPNRMYLKRPGRNDLTRQSQGIDEGTWYTKAGTCLTHGNIRWENVPGTIGRRNMRAVEEGPSYHSGNKPAVYVCR